MSADESVYALLPNTASAVPESPAKEFDEGDTELWDAPVTPLSPKWRNASRGRSSSFEFTKRQLILIVLALCIGSVTLGSLSGVIAQNLYTKIYNKSRQTQTFTPANSTANEPGIKYSDELKDYASDILLTIKTGAAVFFARLPIHLLDEEGHGPLIKNRMYFADFEAQIGGIHVHDVLANVSKEVSKQDQFQPYHTLHQYIEDGQPLADAPSGWELDKYKFLPMHGMAYRAFPDAKFSIHIEADTYLIQENIVRFLQTLNPDDQLYMGSPTIIVGGQGSFAHGGTGYVLSRGLLKNMWGKNEWLEDKYEQLAPVLYFGDALVAEVVRKCKDQGVTIDGPNVEYDQGLQGDPPHSMFFKENICKAIFTFHHITAEDSHRIYTLEKYVTSIKKPEDFIRYIDVYDYFLPHFLREEAPNDVVIRHKWENFAGDRKANPENGQDYNYKFCSKKCEEWNDCWIWSFTEHGENDQPECKLGDRVKFGKPNDKFVSGWFTQRMREWHDKQDCANRFQGFNVTSSDGKTVGKPLPNIFVAGSS